MKQMTAMVAVLAALFLGTAASASAAETSIYIAEQPGFSITFKATGRHVFVTSLRYTAYCSHEGDEGDEVREANGEAFLGPAVELERSGDHLDYLQKVTDVFYSLTALHAEIRPDAIVGTYLQDGEDDCQIIGSSEDDPRVSFTAERYVPLGSALAAQPDPAAPAVYFANATAVEMYLWVDGGAVTDVRGRVLETCVRYRRARPHRIVGHERGSFLLYPPFPLSGSSFSTDAHYGNRTSAVERSVHLSGTVGDADISGLLRETSVGRESGRVEESCRTGTAKRGWVPYQAIRFVPYA